jgi:nucleotide-binding universal stress UspA family protein
VIIFIQEVTVGRTGFLVDPDEVELAGLYRRAQELQGEGIEATVLSPKAPAGGAAPMIVTLAEEAGADMIVVGNRGQGPLARLLLGSVALRLLQTAPCPVLMVPSRQEPEASTAVAGVTHSSLRYRG